MVAGLIATLLAPVTGGLFGLAYGTAIRIGYEQIYPALFPKRGPMGLTPQKKEVIAGLVQMYDIIGGKGAHEFGINVGIQNAMKGIGQEMFKSPELNQLVAIEAGIGGVGVSGGSKGLENLSFAAFGQNIIQGRKETASQIAAIQEELVKAVAAKNQLVIDALQLKLQQQKSAEILAEPSTIVAESEKQKSLATKEIERIGLAAYLARRKEIARPVSIEKKKLQRLVKILELKVSERKVMIRHIKNPRSLIGQQVRRKFISYITSWERSIVVLNIKINRLKF